MLQLTPRFDLARLLTNESSASAFAAPQPTITQPTGEAVIDWQSLSKIVGEEFPVVFPRLVLVPFGTDGSTDLIDLRVIRWNKVGTLWVPLTLFEFQATLGTAAGVAGASVVATELFCSAITKTTGGGNYALSSFAAAAIPASVVCDVGGAHLVQIDLKTDTGATGANALWSPSV